MRKSIFFKKTRKRLSLIWVLMSVLVSTTLQAQVTIGSGTSPERGALLEHKEKDIANPTADVTSLENSEKGVLFPKVFLHDVSKLTPLYGGADDGSGQWSDESTADEKLKATGMIVYNVNPEAKNMDDGLYMWQIDQWVKLNQDGAAVIEPINCSAIRISGSYVEGVALAEANYLEVDVNVSKKGSYAISVMSGNGYNFYCTGVALQAGPLTIKIPGQGTPALVQTDKLIFSGATLVPGCEPSITVQEAIAEFNFVCSSAMVKGYYYKKQPLTSDNVITMNVNVSKPGSYNIYSESKNGVTFKASGTFASVGTQQVTLLGSGIPSVNEDFTIVIKAKTASGSAECSAIIPIILPDMTYAVIGSGSYSWAASARKSALENSSQSFAPTGLVKIKSFKQLWSASSAAAAIPYVTNGVNGKYPDVILYFAYGASPTAALSQALLTYINAGGCVIYGSSDNTSSAVNVLMQGLFGEQTAAAQTGSGSDKVYPIANNPLDPVINGPFGNLAGSYWGEDNVTTGSVIMTSLPANSVQICTAQSPSLPNVNPAYSIVWYNNSKNFLYFGDSTYGAVATTALINNVIDYPTLFTASTYLPVTKMYGPSASDVNKRYITNAALELNAVAFMIKKAAVSGINTY